MRARAIAHPNIALAKYWGKLAGPGNIPAVPSLSVTLAGLATRTEVHFDPALTADSLELNGAPASEEARARASVLLDKARALALGLRPGRTTSFARVRSTNDFPTASGLASSASGFAALAFAALRAAGVDADAAVVADLARQSSASAARSVFSGFAELDGGSGSRGASRQVAPVDAIDLRVLVCVTTEAAKSLGSTGGMNATSERSPYYPAWLTEAPRLHAEIKKALLAGDFAALGEMSERSALAMHALAMAAGVIYVRGATLEAMAAVQELRRRGTAAFATMDAGPHVKVLVQSADAALVATWMHAVPGVLRVIEARPGDGVRVDDEDAGARAVIACAPGKLMLSGAYVVLDGAPTLVAAVNRYARADADNRGPAVSAEARAVYGSASAPLVDVGEMYTGGKKLGLGSSAAALVAALAADRAARGDDVESRVVRDALFQEAREAHRRAQSGGSGADVAASVHGGIVRYRIDADPAGDGRAVELHGVSQPPGLTIVPFWTGSSARTSDLVGRVLALVGADRSAHRQLMMPLAEIAAEAARTFSAGDARGFVFASRAAHRGLAALGSAADAPIVPAAVDELSRLAEADGAAFVVSGAGGGDIALHVSAGASSGQSSGPSTDFFRAAERSGLAPVSLTFAVRGVHREGSSPASSSPLSSSPSALPSF